MGNIINDIYKLRTNFMLIGLTGRTGSGCSSVGKLLCKKNISELLPPIPNNIEEGASNDDRKYKIVYNFLKENWIPFTVIKLSDIIMYFVFLESFENFKNAFDINRDKYKESSEHNLINSLDAFENRFNELKSKAQACDTFLKSIKEQDLTEEEILKEAKGHQSFLLEEIAEFRQGLSDTIKELNLRAEYRVYQEWGNNIRKYGYLISHEGEEAAPSALAEKVNSIIKLLRQIKEHSNDEDKNCLIVLDALRNPYEVLYFRERYSSFYLMSVNTTEEVRKQNLYSLNYRENEIQELDQHEKDGRELSNFHMQDLDKCIELSDIHVVHDGKEIRKNKDLKQQLITYIALMKHPGLIPPSPVERLMQLAYTAKLNSGCLSRQVGAAITDTHYSIKAVGWNTVPQGQTPCNLRSFNDLCALSDTKAFSSFEFSDEKFRKVIDENQNKYMNSTEKLRGVTLSYCFKDLYTVVKGEKNQVHTRSLHAEENAFLQLAKYGSQGINGGKLFTTASPCELCAKKAYQLGIKEIYYIDAYPGISKSHILECGDNKPILILFRGAIGRAYINLYNPIVPLKDEIAYITEVKIERVSEQKKQYLESEK